MLSEGMSLFNVRALPKLTWMACQWSALREFDPRGVGVTCSIQVIDEIGYANPGHDVHIDLSYDTPLHRLVVQVRNIRRIDCDVLFGNAVVSICASHDGGLRPESRRFDKRVLRQITTTYHNTVKTLLRLSTMPIFRQIGK
jgi:hypothetical protein